MGDIIGWDVGGAHLKAARVSEGHVVEVVQLPCTLWQGLTHLETAFAAMRERIGDAPRHAITTTGELTDLFTTRQEGVALLVAALQRMLMPAELAVYAGRRGFVTAQDAAAHAADVASANWHASASIAARHCDALLVDMGSTTTDIIPVAGGKVVATAHNDADRLASGELVYTGMTRSFLMAECRKVPLRGRYVPLMNEYFANMADVYRILGLLDQAHDQHATADGRDKSVEHSRARLARMLGMDVNDATEGEWHLVATWFMHRQIQKIMDATYLVCSRNVKMIDVPIVSAGIGSLVVEKVAARLNRPCRSFSSVIGIDAKQLEWASACAPAAAVALLLHT